MRYDVVVVGSGFGGSVAALRLAEKGYTVAVLEAGRRFGPDDFPRTNWNMRRFLFAPRLGCHGIQRITFLRDVVVLSGAGVGGGSRNLRQFGRAIRSVTTAPAPSDAFHHGRNLACDV